MTALLRRAPGVTEQLAENYVHDWPDPGRTEVRMGDLDKLLDVERLHEVLQEVELPEGASDKAQWLFALLSGDGYRKLLEASREPETSSTSDSEEE